MHMDGFFTHRSLEDVVPPELVARFMDFLNLSDLLHVMAVSRQWQDLAVEHPTYWRDLSLDEFQTMQPSHIRLFRLRLCRSRGRPVSIVLRYLPSEPSESQLLPDISQHLSHVQHLDYSSGNDDIRDALFDALARPAPIQRTLCLALHRRDPVAIRADLLGGFAPKLRRATIENANLPSPIPHGLRTLEHLTLVNASLPDLSHDLPGVNHLHLCRDTNLDPVYLKGRAWTGIRLVCFDAGVIARDWHRRGLAVARVPTVIVRAAYASGFGDPGAAESLAALVTHVDGGVGVHVVRQAPHQLWVDLRGTSEVSSALERGVMLVNQQLPDADTPLPFPGSGLAAGFSDRIVYLSINFASWEIALCLGELPVLDALVMLLQTDEPVPVNSDRLSCPLLRRLVLRGGLPGTVMSVALPPFARFARCSLHAVQLPLALELQRVELLAGEDAECEAPTFRSPTTTEYRGDHRWL